MPSTLERVLSGRKSGPVIPLSSLDPSSMLLTTVLNWNEG